MTHKLLVVAAAIALAACSSDGQTTNSTASPTTKTATTAQPTTTSTAPISTAVPTATGTSAPPSTALPTVAPPTSAGGSPQEIAEAEVLQTLDAFWEEVDGCLAAPNDCDVDRVIATYTVDSPVIAKWLSENVTEFKAQNLHLEGIELEERTLREISADPAGFAFTSQCEISRAALVEVSSDTTSVVDDGVGYGRYDFTWTKTDGRWVIAQSSQMGLTGTGDGGCEF